MIYARDITVSVRGSRFLNGDHKNESRINKEKKNSLFTKLFDRDLHEIKTKHIITGERP
jgi:hypothetical protein